MCVADYGMCFPVILNKFLLHDDAGLWALLGDIGDPHTGSKQEVSQHGRTVLGLLNPSH